MKKLVNIKTHGPIKEMGHIVGPILVPCKIDVEKIEKMLKNGKTIVEVNPNNHDERVSLNLDNLRSDNFGTAPKKEFTEPKIEEVQKDQVEKAVDISTQKNEVEQEIKQETKTTSQENKNQNSQKSNNKGSKNK